MSISNEPHNRIYHAITLYTSSLSVQLPRTHSVLTQFHQQHSRHRPTDIRNIAPTSQRYSESRQCSITHIDFVDIFPTCTIYGFTLKCVLSFSLTLSILRSLLLRSRWTSARRLYHRSFLTSGGGGAVGGGREGGCEDRPRCTRARAWRSSSA